MFGVMHWGLLCKICPSIFPIHKGCNVATIFFCSESTVSQLIITALISGHYLGSWCTAGLGKRLSSFEQPQPGWRWSWRRDMASVNPVGEILGLGASSVPMAHCDRELPLAAQWDCGHCLGRAQSPGHAANPAGGSQVFHYVIHVYINIYLQIYIYIHAFKYMCVV